MFIQETKNPEENSRTLTSVSWMERLTYRLSDIDESTPIICVVYCSGPSSISEGPSRGTTYTPVHRNGEKKTSSFRYDGEDKRRFSDPRP